MARMRYAKQEGPLPPPLPPETRTVGQLVAESIKLYQRRFWQCLGLGFALSIVNQVSAIHPKSVPWQAGVLLVLGTPLLTAAYVAAVAIVHGERPRGRTLITALGAGALAWIPVPFLELGYLIPALLWLSLVGLAVPVAIVERVGVRAAFRRALRLFRADPGHAFFSIFTITLVFVLTRVVLALLLKGQGQATGRVAAFLADTVVSPLLFIGPALLYVDQVARLALRRGAAADPSASRTPS